MKELLVHKVQYYETDQMGFAHHSNYARWMEEARMSYMEQADLSYQKVESLGMFAPVLSLTCDFKETTTFGDTLRIDARILRYTGVRLTFGYTIRKENGVLVAEGTTEHCFIHADHSLIRVKKEFPEVHAVLEECVVRDTSAEVGAET